MKKLLIPLILIILLTGCKSYPKAVKNGDYVFYTPNGKSYHSIKDCPTLNHSSVIKGGYLNILTGMPKIDACDICVKQ